MDRSEDNGKVDVAPMRMRRAWSAPAAPLSHLRRSTADTDGVDNLNDVGRRGEGISGSSSCSSGSNRAQGAATRPVELPHALYRLFPTKTCFAVVDIVYAADTPATESGGGAAPALSTSAPAYEALRAELQAAKHQIALLTTASSQSFGSYAALETENAELRRTNAQLQEDNEALKERLAQRDDEISEQLHMICDLEKKLKEFSAFSLTNKSTWNGRNGA